MYLCLCLWINQIYLNRFTYPNSSLCSYLLNPNLTTILGIIYLYDNIIIAIENICWMPVIFSEQSLYVTSFHSQQHHKLGNTAVHVTMRKPGLREIDYNL